MLVHPLGLLFQLRMIVSVKVAHAKQSVLDRSWITRQIESSFNVMERLKITPSTEFLYGWDNNIFLGVHQNVTFFDFNAYQCEFSEEKRRMHDKHAYKEFNSTHHRLTKERLLWRLLDFGMPWDSGARP